MIKLNNIFIDNIVKSINFNYDINVEKIKLHRDMIGYVFIVFDGKKEFILKISRPINKLKAFQSMEIMDFLFLNNYPVPKIYKTKIDKESYIKLDMPEGISIACLLEFIKGYEPNINDNIERLGGHIGKLHSLMKKYPKKLISYNKEFYIDRFIKLLEVNNYDSDKIIQLKDYGKELWDYMQRLPKSFCHGDLHSGNMIENNENTFFLFDFDVASNTNSTIDVSTICNQTNFNFFSANDYDKTTKTFNEFYSGYVKETDLSYYEIKAIYHFIAIRHYELIATISEVKGIKDNSIEFLNQQYNWLMNWRNICYKN